jgi:hypothetical protein
MADPLRTLEEQALKLGEKDRAELARVLLLSLNGPEEPSDEAVWAEEAERRYRELASGSVEATPTERVLDEARSRLVRHLAAVDDWLLELEREHEPVSPETFEWAAKLVDEWAAGAGPERRQTS